MSIGLADYLQKLEDIGAPMRTIMREFKFTLLGLILESFDKEQDPNENKWAQWSPKYHRPEGNILNLSGDMRKSFKVSTSAHQFTMTNTAPYAKYHQEGTEKMVARKILPDEQLPEKWKLALQDVVFMSFQEYFGGK